MVASHRDQLLTAALFPTYVPTPGSECILQNTEIVEEEIAMAYLVTSKATFMFSNAKPVLNEN